MSTLDDILSRDYSWCWMFNLRPSRSKSAPKHTVKQKVVLSLLVIKIVPACHYCSSLSSLQPRLSCQWTASVFIHMCLAQKVPISLYMRFIFENIALSRHLRYHFAITYLSTPFANFV